MSRFWRSFEFELGPPTLIHWPWVLLLSKTLRTLVYINWLIILFIVDNRRLIQVCGLYLLVEISKLGIRKVATEGKHAQANA
jgi:uncharacterized membrane protein YoaT (DUF817 family)